MKEETEDINLSEYGYAEGDKISLDAKQFTGLINFMEELFSSNEELAFEHPSKFESYEDYFKQPTMIKTITPIGFRASFFLLGLRDVHYKNIKGGVAKKLNEIVKEQNDTTFESVISSPIKAQA